MRKDKEELKKDLLSTFIKNEEQLNEATVENYEEDTLAKMQGLTEEEFSNLPWEEVERLIRIKLIDLYFGGNSK